MSRILLKGITILPMTRKEDLIRKGDILIEGKTISYVGQQKEWLDDVEVFEGENKVALPGLVNAHTHLAMTLMRGYADDMILDHWLMEKIWPLEAKLKPEHIYIGSLMGIAELIASGITTFSDMYFHMDQVAKAVQETGMRASLSQGLIATNNPFPMKVLQSGLSFAQKYRGSASGRITTMLGPHAPYTCPPNFLKAVRETAYKENLPLHIHLSETKKEVQDCLSTYEMTPPQLLDSLGLLDLPVLAAHSVILENEDFAILRKAQGIAHCPISNLKTAAGVAPVDRLLKEGVNVSLGTDGAASNNRLELFQEMKSASLLAKATTSNPESIPAFEALQMATSKGAKALCLEKEIGTLEVGKKADILILDFSSPRLFPIFDYYSHIVYNCLPEDVDSVMVDGGWLFKGKKYQTLDWLEIKKEAEKALKELL